MSPADIPMSPAETAWLRGRHGAVYLVLQASLESPLAALVPGTACTIDAALAHFRHTGDAVTVRRLEAIALTVHALNLGLRSGAGDDVVAHRRRLNGLAKDWLAAAPMFPAEARREAMKAA